MLPSRSLTDLSHALSADGLLASARRIEGWRSPAVERDLNRWFGLDIPGAWTTPFMLRAGLTAAAHGIVSFDRLERVFLPPAPSWVHPEIGPAGYGAQLGPELLYAPQLWPFSQDCPAGDFQSAKLPAKWLSHSLVHTLVGFGHWPGLTEWQLMCMARLSEAMASFHWYWLAELGRLDHRGLRLDLSNLTGTDAALYTLLELQAQDPDQRLVRLSEETSSIIADNALEILNYETYAYRQGVYEGDLVEPTDAYLGFGEACEYAKTHLPRLMSPAYRRYLELCHEPGIDYARTPDEFEARAARALAAILDDAPPAPFDPRQRAVRTLQDVAWRLSHADALAPHAETDAALRALADAIATARTAADPDQVAADTLTDAMARFAVSPTPKVFVSAPGAAAAFALGYSPVSDPTREPEGMRDLRALALVRRAYALHPALGAALEGMMPVARRALAAPVRRAGVIEQLIAVAEDSARAGEVPWLGYAYLGWMQVAAGAWQSSDPASASQRWHYRLARRYVPDDPAVFSEYEVAWNPYLKRNPLPFDAKWNEELRRTRPGEAKTFKGKNTTSVWYCYMGPGRERPVYLPLVARLNALIFHMKSPRRLDELVKNPDFGLDFIRDAVADEAVLLFHKPRFDRPERALDVFEVAMEMAAGLDSSLEPFGPWDEEAQAEAYMRFCETSGHYRESSAALCDVVGIPTDAFVGELGFGTGETTRQILSRLGPQGRYFGVDAAPRMLNHMLETTLDDRVRFQAGGARALAWTAAYEGGFDRIVANACIWLVPNLSEALDNLLRAAVQAGRLALSIPAEYLGYVDHLQSEPAIAVATALTAVRADLAIEPPGPEAQASSPDKALGDTQRFVDALRAAGWDKVELHLWERPWTVGEYIDWLAMPVVSEGLCHAKDKGRATDLIAALRQRVDPALPLTAVWYFITAERP